MKRSNNGKKGNGYWGKAVLFCMAFYALSFAALGAIDYWAPWFSDKCDNHIAGNVWFSVIASIISAGPSVAIAVLAIKQNQDLAELQNKHHVPSLVIDSVAITEEFLNWEIYSKSNFFNNYPANVRRLIEEYKEHNSERNAGLLQLKMKLLLKNDVSINRIDIDYVTFKIKEKDYKFAWNISDAECLRNMQTCKRYFDGGLEFYQIEWNMINYISNDSNVWEELSNIMLESANSNKRYRNVEIEVEMRFYFINLEEQVLPYKLTASFTEKADCIEPSIMRLETQDGRIVPGIS